jgi:hypothetical protein
MMREWHKEVPRDVQKNVEYRQFLLSEWLQYGPLFEAEMRQAVQDDLLFYINAFVWQANPKSTGEGSLPFGPFVTWDFQDELALTLNEHIDEGRDCILEKSRDMGASWACLLLFDWRARAKKRQKFLVISRNADAVDDADEPDSCFWKLDFVHRHLPEWLQGDVRRRKMRFVFNDTDSYITGQASTGMAGVGGRATAILVDEFSLIREDRAVFQRTADTSDCRIFNGTHYGLDTMYFELTNPDSAIGAYIDKIQLHWSQHPDKRKGLYRSASPVEVIDRKYEYSAEYDFVMDGSPSGGAEPGLRSPWYDKECMRRRSKRDVAMHLDINPQGSLSEFFDPLVIRSLMARAEEPAWVGEPHFNRDSGEECSLVASPDGHLKLWMNPRYDGKVAPGIFTIAADIATGTGGSPSCLSVVRARGDRAGQKVAEYENADIKPEAFGTLAVALGRLFCSVEGRPAFMVWEKQGPGTTFGQQVMALNYHNVYFKRDIFDQRQVVSEKPGWHPTADTKRILLDDYRMALARGLFENRSEWALKQCLSFEFKGSSVAHALEEHPDPSRARTNHGDMVIADALAWLGCKELGFAGLPEDVAPPLVVGSLGWRRALHEVKRPEEIGW